MLIYLFRFTLLRKAVRHQANSTVLNCHFRKELNGSLSDGLTSSIVHMQYSSSLCACVSVEGLLGIILVVSNEIVSSNLSFPATCM